MDICFRFVDDKFIVNTDFCLQALFLKVAK